MSEPIITFDKVNKWYGNNFHVLRDIDLIRRQRRAHRHLRAIWAPASQRSSGVSIALEEHQQGSSTRGWDGVALSSTTSRPSIKVRSNEVGMVFQQFNLFPHLTDARRTCTLAPIWVRKGCPRQEADETRHAATSSAYKIAGAGGQSTPVQLSGGQQQRVAIARGLVPDGPGSCSSTSRPPHSTPR